jgi:ribosomal protein S27E
MITIVNREPHQSVVKEVICRHCGVTLNYTPNDIQHRTDTDYTGGSETVYYIKCPNCTHDISVKRY